MYLSDLWFRLSAVSLGCDVIVITAEVAGFSSYVSRGLARHWHACGPLMLDYLRSLGPLRRHLHKGALLSLLDFAFVSCPPFCDSHRFL